jgi:hypothetical protein
MVTIHLPIAPSLTRRLCAVEQLVSNGRICAGDALAMNALTAVVVSTVADRIHSVRPLRNAAVLDDSYVGTTLLYCLKNAN